MQYRLFDQTSYQRHYLGWDYLVNCIWGGGLWTFMPAAWKRQPLVDDNDYEKSNKKLLVNVNIIRHNHYYLLLVFDSIILMVFILTLVS